LVTLNNYEMIPIDNHFMVKLKGVGQAANRLIPILGAGLIILSTVSCSRAGPPQVTIPLTTAPASPTMPSTSALLPVATVPPSQKALYDELDRELARFETILNGKWDGKQGQTVFATELSFANGNIGEGLLLPDTMERNRILLDQLQKMGIKGVVLSIKFPLLDHSFPRSAEYLKFYKEIAAEASRHGMKILVETGAVFSGTAFSSVKVDWSKYTSASFLKAMQDQLVLIATEIKPDYLTLTEEPKTQEALTKLRFTNTDWIGFVDSILKRIDHSGGMLLGAGLGSWEDQALAASFIKMPGLDYLDLHIYPPGKNAVFMERALNIALEARKAGKRVTIGECWLYKAPPDELGGGPGVDGDVFNNDVFSFWYPLDARFVKDIIGLADAAGMDFVSFFWMRNFLAYLDYENTPKNLSTAESNRMINQAALANLGKGALSPLGQYYQQQMQGRSTGK
jgi:hypothetical protein